MKHYVGIDLGGTNVVVGIVDENYNIVHKEKIKTMAELGFEKIVKNIGKLVNSAIENSGVDKNSISSVGLGTPSCINPKTGLLVYANNMGWRNVPLYDELKKYVSYPLYIKNDADCAALGEALCGGTRDYDSALMITLGTGVGGGMIINKKIFNGCDNMGAEFGHTKLVFDGELCTCGQKGCFESYASATAFINQTKKAVNENPSSLMTEICGGNLQNINGRTAFDAAKKGDKVAIELVDKYVSYLAGGLSSLICVFRPEAIIIGGGIGNEGEYLLKPLREKILVGTYGVDVIGAPQVVSATLGNDAGVIGAAFLEIS